MIPPARTADRSPPSAPRGPGASSGSHESSLGTAAAVDGPLVLFDGVCGLCNATVDFILRNDRRGVFRLAPLQGTTAAERLSAEEREMLDSVVYVGPDAVFRHSSAVVRVLWRLGGAWTVLGYCLWLVPRPLRDWGYRLIARNRYRWFGRKETCRLPTPAEAGRLLP